MLLIVLLYQFVVPTGVWGLSSTNLRPGKHWEGWGTKSSESRIKSNVGLNAATSLFLGKTSWELLRRGSVMKNTRDLTNERPT